MTLSVHDDPELRSRVHLPPRDIRTIRKDLNVDPLILRTVSCPKCYAQYELADAPDTCTWHQAPAARACGTALFVARTQRVSGAHRVPRLLYNRQCFDTWLSWFLNRPGIEDEIEKSYRSADFVPPRVMRSIWDSPSWFRGFEQEPRFSCKRGNLTFGLYIDWYNPWYDTIRGRSTYAFCHKLDTND